MERQFPIDPGQPGGMVLAIFYSFAESAPRWNLLRKKRAMSRFVETERQVFQFHRSGLFGTTSVGDPEYSCHKEPKRTFSFDFQPKFPEFFFHSTGFPLWLVHLNADVCCDWLLTLALCRFQLLWDHVVQFLRYIWPEKKTWKNREKKYTLFLRWNQPERHKLTVKMD